MRYAHMENSQIGVAEAEIIAKDMVAEATGGDVYLRMDFNTIIGRKPRQLVI